jgi:radical SAM superfamily enzyme YgiQ (UPF0313 family)
VRRRVAAAGADAAGLRLPAFELLDIANYNRLTVQTSRGCPHRCEFCASSVLLTAQYKQKPVAKVLAEIERIFQIWEHPFIEFADDNSMVDKAYWRELLRGLKGRRFRWFAETDISVAEDAELLDPFPGTPLFARLAREERLLAPGRWERCTLFDVNFRPTPMSVQQLADGFKRLAVELYSEEFTSWRRGNFRRLLHNRHAAEGGSP